MLSPSEEQKGNKAKNIKLLKSEKVVNLSEGLILSL